jgi:choline dehydrogenase-like flavoprotein
VDVYHPSGSTRMGTDGRSAVADQDLQTFSISNLWVLSISAFSSSAGANPTLYAMRFAARLVDRFGKRLVLSLVLMARLTELAAKTRKKSHARRYYSINYYV